MSIKDAVTIIILNWNGKHFLEKNIDSILSQDYTNYKVLIVDNGSKDGSINYIKKRIKKDKKLSILELKKNIGYTGGNNSGIREILKKGKNKYIAILNNDIKVEQQWLNNLISGFNDSSIGICTSKLLLYYPYQQVILIPRKNTLLESLCINNLNYHLLEYKNGFENKGERLLLPKKLKAKEIYYFAVPYDNHKNTEIGRLKIKYTGDDLKLFSGEIKKEINKNSIIKLKLNGKYIIQNAGTDFIRNKMVFKDKHLFEFNRELPSGIADAACGGAMAIRADLLEKLGLFKEEYFLYNDDSEISFRYHRAGFLTKFINDAVCYHYFWGSSKGSVTKNQTYYGTRNRLWFIKEYFGIFTFFYYYFRTLARTFIWGLKSLFGNKNAKMFFTCYIKALDESLKR